VDLELTDEQVALRDELRRFLGDRVSSESLRARAELPGAVDRGLWRELGDLGVFSLTRPEADGGAGLGLAEAAVVFEELGRAAVPGPLVASLVAAGRVDGAATGERVVGAVVDADPAVVEHLEGLDVLLVLRADGLDRLDRPERARPMTRPLDPLTPVHVVAGLAPGERIGGADAVAELRTVGGLLTAALQVGLGEAAVVLATAYALERQQFDRAIGSFQAVKHLLADAHVWVDVARAAVHSAAVELDELEEGQDPGGATCGVDAARIVAARATARATATCVQVHGGMGYTWEVDAHLLLKRAAVLDVAFGSVDESIDRRALALAAAAV
jgi:alkylation response protein AidB-like acyl-CoA dehydrogenase